MALFKASLATVVLVGLLGVSCGPNPTPSPLPSPSSIPTATAVPLPTETPVAPDEPLLRYAEALKLALETNDRLSLASLIAQEGFLLGGYRSEYVLLTKEEALSELEGLHAPSQVVVRLNVDAIALAGEFISPPPGTTQVLFSTGWGPDGADDAFLMIGEEDGMLRWTAMIYVVGTLRDYPLPRPPG